MTSSRDATLALVVLAIAILAARLTTTQPAVRPFLGGAIGGVVLEALATRHADRVRSAWAHGAVRGLVLGIGFGVVVLAAVVAPAPGLNALAGGLVAYLALVALAAVGAFDDATRTEDAP